jgi:prepilin-type N-terminal cleavage/methylation domain-containing protein
MSDRSTMYDRSTMSQRDRGMTLPELLISVVLTGLLVVAITASATVVLKTADNNEGRLNNARSEQNVNVWMPSDLTSAENVRTEANLLPCGPQLGSTNTYAACPAGLDLSNTSNTMLLTWFGSAVNGSNEPVDTVTVVSYRYGEFNGEWALQRVSCEATETGPNTNTFGAWSCESMMVLHDMPAPPLGVNWVPGTTSPEWVIKVTSALAADSVVTEDESVDDPGLTTKNAKRVLVTIDGGGDAAGGGGGEKTFSFSAGGTDREIGLSTDDLTGAPTFTAARTRCGGNYGLIVDRSKSIGDDFGNVRTGILNFIDTFAGKPVKLQIVTFDTDADTVDDPADPNDDWTAYFDMLDPADVQTLRDQISVLDLGLYTNWEDGWFRMLRNEDGTVRSIIPDKVIFFTDGMPNRSRLNDYSGTSGSVIADPRDAGLSNTTNYNLNQVAWNRTARLIENTGVTDVVGVYVGADVSATARWEYAGPGYVWQYQRGDGVEYQRGYNATYERGNGVTPERGYHVEKQRGNTVVYERGYNATYQIGSGLTFQRRQDSRMTFQRWTGSTWSTTTSTGATITWATYLTNNTVAGDSDGWRPKLNSGGTASWTNITLADFVESNTTTDSNDGFRTVVSGSSGSWSWANITAAQYTAINTTTDSNDGAREVKNYASPYTAWESSTQTSYNTANTVAGESDGWRTRATSTPSSWTAVSDAEYEKSNTTADSADGYRIANAYTSPYSAWEATTWATYDGSNSATGEGDGWRARVTGTSTTWTATTKSVFDKSNTTADESDGWRDTITEGGTSVWQASTQSLYEAGNVDSGTSDGWRTAVVGANNSWTAVTLAQYNGSNTTSDSNDGWRAVKYYPENGPFDGFDGQSFSAAVPTRTVLEALVAPEGVVPAVYDSTTQSYGDVRDVNMFAETNWSLFDDAIRDVALGECGGTVTLQTKNQATGGAVADTFTYSNAQLQTVETSGAYRSGTFDVAQPGGAPSTLVVTPQNLTTLNAWQHVSWSCTSQGQTLGAPDMTVGEADPSGWRTLSLNVRPNQAISCVQTVAPR